MGVDLFFVISGYLITTILMEDIATGKLSILSFYERRARRILPALFFMMAFTLLPAWLYMLPSQLKDFCKSLIAVSLFGSNILFWRETGYFANASEEKPLLHTWSLAVEEQFYLLFPVFLLCVWRLGRPQILRIVTLIALASLLLSEWGWRNFPSANFYLAPGRAWELLAGAIAAFHVMNGGVRRNNLLALTGLAVVVGSILFFDRTTPFPGFIAVLPVTGVALVIIFGHETTLVGKLLSARPIVGIGLVSYSAYLWHQPLFAFARINTLNQLNTELIAGIFLLTFVLAVFSYRYIETPFRKKARFSQKEIFSFSIFGIAVFCVVGLGHDFWEKIRFRNNTAILELDTAAKDWGFPGELIYDEANAVYTARNNHPSDVLFFGDSHAQQYGVLAKGLLDLGLNVSFLTGGGCPPIPGVFEDKHPHCKILFDKLKKYLDRDSDIETIVIAGCFNCYFIHQAVARERSGKQEYDYYFQSDSGVRLYYRDGFGIEESFWSLQDFINKLAEDYQVILMGDNPYSPFMDPGVLMQFLIRKPHVVETKYGDHDWQSTFQLSPLERQLNEKITGFSRAGVATIDVSEIVCPRNTCSAFNEKGHPIYKDAHHMRPGFVKKEIMEPLRDLIIR